MQATKSFSPLFLLTLVLTCCSYTKNDETVTLELPYYSTPDWMPVWISQDSLDHSGVHQIADFTFFNQDGQTVTQESIAGKVYVANFFFSTCPGVCPKMTNNLHLVQDEFLSDERVRILSHTVMPWVDSVAQLSSYAKRNQIKAETWDLVTGTKNDLYNLARNSYFADEGFGKTLTTEEDFLHTEKLILIDQNRHIRGVYNGILALDTKRLIADIYSLIE